MQITLEEIRAEICGDEGLRGNLKEYTNNPGSASLVNSIIGSLVTVAALHGIPIDGAIAHQIIVEKHGGTLEVNSTLGEGTEFTITIPIKAINTDPFPLGRR